MIHMRTLKDRLARTMEEDPKTLHWYARRIGISVHTLITVLSGERDPRRLTRWKIEQYLKGKNV